MCRQIIFICVFIICVSRHSGYALHVRITNDGPVVLGGTINFQAAVYDDYNHVVQSGKFRYEWKDDGIPKHTDTKESNSTCSWSITYNASIYRAGSYVVRAEVCEFVWWGCSTISSSGTEFDVTGTFNGKIDLIQNNHTRDSFYVSNDVPVIHAIDFKKSDWDYVSKAPTVLSYWFVGCTYYGITNDLKFPFNYTVADQEYMIEALVMADFTPLPPPTTVAPSTTTTKTTTVKPTSAVTTTSTTAITPKPSSSFLKSNAASGSMSSSTLKINKRSVNETKVETKRIMVESANRTLVPYNGTFPFVCNGSWVTEDSKKTYGYFFKRIVVKAPVSKVNVTGKNWLEPGDLLTLRVVCKGSQKMEFCIHYIVGEYNVTGNETCRDPRELMVCDFKITRYLSVQHTILIIIQNEVSKVVTPVTVKISTYQKPIQLSVIFVPVTFSIVAVVLIVFGVAYYMQNRSRFVVEVADFNFGKQYSDMEYKTFRERLRDSIMNAFSRGPTPSSSEVPVWPPGGRKYGSLT